MSLRAIVTCFFVGVLTASSAVSAQSLVPAQLVPSATSYYVTNFYGPGISQQGSVSLSVHALTANGTPIRGIAISFTSLTPECGSFDGAVSVQNSTDRDGMSVAPAWKTRYGILEGVCLIKAEVFGIPTVATTVTVHVGTLWGDPLPLPSPAATRIAYVDAQHEFDATPAQALPILRAATVDESGNRISFQRVVVSTTCNDISGQPQQSPFEIFSDAAGIVIVPAQRFPSPGWGKCTVTVFLAKDFHALPLGQVPQVAFNFYDPSVVWYVVPMNGASMMTAQIGQVVTGLRFELLNARRGRVPKAAVDINSGDCGTFAGARQEEVVADASGVVEVPPWTAPLHADLCRVFISHTGALALLRIDVRDRSIQDGDTFIQLGGSPDSIVGRDDVPNTKFRLKPNTAGGFSFSLTDYCTACIERYDPFAQFAPPSGRPLVPGSYTPVQLYTDSGGMNAGLWAGSGAAVERRCDAMAGSFVVHELVLAADGWPSRFAADFWQRCNGDSAPLVGGVRFNSNVPYPGPSAPTIAVTTASGYLPSGQLANLTVAGVTTLCTIESAVFGNPAQAPLPVANPGLVNTHGYLDARVGNCGFGQPITFTVDVGKALPPTAQWWIYGPTQDDRSPHWHVIASAVDGSRITFTIADGGLGDDNLAMNGSVEFRGMVAIPNGPMQDLWWSGPAENGWGMSIIQHRDVLFANVFVYDAHGNPIWYVMPSGNWNEAHTAYEGALYLPKAAPYFAYDARKFDIGPSVGTARLAFSGVDQAAFEYTIDGITGRKQMTRSSFGPAAPPTDMPLGDLWWGGLGQNGWGLALVQQHSSLFGLWFTYDASGAPTWFVMPDVQFVAKDIYLGSIYKPQGSAWLGVQYEATRHRMQAVGTFRLRFEADSTAFDYTFDTGTAPWSGSAALTRIPF
jgi:hypothetical protein